jgi:hypothetical protein
MLRLKACKPDIEIVEADDSDPDPMEYDDAELPMDPDAGCAVWNECFEKFYFSKKDDWQKFRKTILAMYEDVQHLWKVDKESEVPTLAPIPPTPHHHQLYRQPLHRNRSWAPLRLPPTQKVVARKQVVENAKDSTMLTYLMSIRYLKELFLSKYVI